MTFIEDQWPRFRAHRIDTGKRSTRLGFLAAFRDKWLPEELRFARTRKDVEAQEDRDQRALAALRLRENDRLAAQRAEDARASGPPDPETLRRMAKLEAAWDREAPSRPRQAVAPALVDAWTPPDPEKLAAVRAELEAAIAAAGGRQ